MKDVRTNELKPQRLDITISMEVVVSHSGKGFINNLSDELGELLTKRLNETVGFTHLKTTTWDLRLGEQ